MIGDGRKDEVRDGNKEILGRETDRDRDGVQGEYSVYCHSTGTVE